MSSIGMGLGAATSTGRMLEKLGFSSELGKVLRAAESGNGLDQSVKNLVQTLQGALGGSAAGQGATPAFAPGAMEKVLYLSVLRAAIQKATETPHFNMETQINDLWVKLSNIRRQKPSGDFQKLQELMQKQSELMKMLSQIIMKYDQSAKNIIQSLGR